MSGYRFFNPTRKHWDVSTVTDATTELLTRHTEARDTVIAAARELALTIGDGEDCAVALLALEEAIKDFDTFARTWEG